MGSGIIDAFVISPLKHRCLKSFTLAAFVGLNAEPSNVVIVTKWFVFWIKNLPLFPSQRHRKLEPTSADTFSTFVIISSLLVKDNKYLLVYMISIWDYVTFRHPLKKKPKRAWSVGGRKWTYSFVSRPKGHLLAAVMCSWDLSKRHGFLWIPSRTSSAFLEYIRTVCVTVSPSCWCCSGHIKRMYNRPWHPEMLPITRKMAESGGCRGAGTGLVVIAVCLGRISECVF